MKSMGFQNQANRTSEPLLLRGSEVADALGISRALAYRWMAGGILPTVRVSRSVRVPQEALRDWIRANTTSTARPAAA